MDRFPPLYLTPQPPLRIREGEQERSTLGRASPLSRVERGFRGEVSRSGLAKIALAAILLMVSFLMLTPTFAQGDVIIVDETGALDTTLIQQNAQPLLNRGASVAVYIMETDNGILPALRDDLIVVYVSLDPRMTRVLSGRDWSEKLENRGEYVRETTLYSHLDARDYNRVVNDILLRIEVALQNDEAAHDTRIRLMVLGAVGVALVFGMVLQFSGVFK